VSAVGGRHAFTGPHFAPTLIALTMPKLLATLRHRIVTMRAAGCAAVVLLAVVSGASPTSPRQQQPVTPHLANVRDVIPLSSGTAGSASLSAPGTGAGVSPAAAGAFANPAPPSLALQPPLRPHEDFAFVPYWSLGDSNFSLIGISTVAYFSLTINPNGSIQDSGPGWQGYESQQLIQLIDRAHAADDRVVITANDFSQSSLNQLTSSAAAAHQLAQSLLFVVKSRNLDGVNLDLEGQGSSDQAGLTRLVAQVSTTLHAANPDYQVTMDTYASSAGDPQGFYDIPALNPYVNGFFVMAYQLNLQSAASPGSPLTSTMFSNRQAVEQYDGVVPSSKVLLGLPFFGYDWPTTNGTLTAKASGAPSIITYGQELSSGHPIYWDGVTDTGWTSYKVGAQWHEAYFEDPQSLYLGAELAQAGDLGGVGIWALGMNDANEPSMVTALDGFAPVEKSQPTGPAPTTTTTTMTPPPRHPSGAKGGTTTTTSSTTTTSTTTPTTSTTTTSSTTTTTTTIPGYVYSGTWAGNPVTLTVGKVASGTTETLIGTLAGFTTDNPKFSCLEAETTLPVFTVSSDPGHDYVITHKANGYCADGTFLFTPPAGAPSGGTTPTSPSGAPLQRSRPPS
jgi:spore germination protein YaaH